MADPVHLLVLDLLESIAPRPRAYAEVLAAWRTSCPRLPIWEDALERDLLEVHQGDGGVLMVRLTPSGRELVERRRGGEPTR